MHVFTTAVKYSGGQNPFDTDLKSISKSQINSVFREIFIISPTESKYFTTEARQVIAQRKTAAVGSAVGNHWTPAAHERRRKSSIDRDLIQDVTVEKNNNSLRHNILLS